MPVISPFPTENLGGPRMARYDVQDPEYPTDVGQPYKGGGTDYWIRNDTKTLFFICDYKTDGCVEEIEAAILDAHYDEAKGKTYGFDFYDKNSGIIYTNVHYESYERSHGKRTTIQFRMVKLKWVG